jgi:copper transport protein
VRRVAVVALLALALPGQAMAHATLRAETPRFQERLARTPAVIRLQFDQEVSLPSIKVLDSDGRNYAGPAATVGRTIAAHVRTLPTGVYPIRWHATSADSHTVSGVWTFGVRVDAPPPTEAYGASGPTRTEHVVRWLYFLSLALLLGSLGLRLVCLRGLSLPPRTERRLLLVAGVGVVAVLEVGILAFCLRAEDALQLPFGKFLYGDLSPISGGTRFGTAFVSMTLGYALVAALLALAWITDRRWFLPPAFLLALGFA